jgi:hypothetical protein
MIIDDMNLLYTGRFSRFCIISSDSHFTRLAAHIREHGIPAYGFGERKTNPSLISAFSEFVYFDMLNNIVGEPEEAPAAPRTPEPGAAASSEMVIRPRSQNAAGSKKPRPLDKAALETLATVVNNSIGYDDGYANLADVGNNLSRISPDLNARNYGSERLREFAEVSGIVNIKLLDMGDKPRVCLVKLRNQ